MGSGASGVAALKYGCFYIGLDSDGAVIEPVRTLLSEIVPMSYSECAAEVCKVVRPITMGIQHDLYCMLNFTHILINSNPFFYSCSFS